MSENLIVYVVLAITVPVGVRVRLPAFVQAPVALKIAGVTCEILRSPELLVDPERPLSTMVVFFNVPCRQVA